MPGSQCRGERHQNQRGLQPCSEGGAGSTMIRNCVLEWERQDALFTIKRDRTENKRVAGNSTHAYPTQPPETMEISGSMLPQRNMSLSLILE